MMGMLAVADPVNSEASITVIDSAALPLSFVATSTAGDVPGGAGLKGGVFSCSTDPG